MSENVSELSAGLIERINMLRGAQSLKAYSEAIGVGYQTMRSIMAGGHPRIDTFVDIAAAAGVSVEWLATGEGVQRPGPVAPNEPTLNDAAELISIPRLDVRASAGGGLSDGTGDLVGHQDIMSSFLRSLGCVPGRVALVENRGDSMMRPDGTGIPDGSLSIVDTRAADEPIITGAIYVFSIDDVVLIKRLERNTDGTLTYHADNPRYEPVKIDREDMQLLRIGGIHKGTISGA